MVRYDLFISYAQEDAEYAGRLHAALVDMRLSVFFGDASIRPGDSISDGVRLGLLGAGAMVVVVSLPSTTRSRWVSMEIEMFLAVTPRRRVLPILVSGSVEAFPRISAIKPLPAGDPTADALAVLNWLRHGRGGTSSPRWALTLGPPGNLRY